MATEVKMKIVRLEREDGTKVKMPAYGHASGDACFDIFAANLEPIVIKPHSVAKIPTGLVIQLEDGYHLEIHNKSGIGSNKNVQLAHCTGKGDNNYRGEYFIPIYNRNDYDFIVEPGMKICQAQPHPDYIAVFQEVDSIDDLTETERGAGGFGSTGLQ